jgi:hypothetical protein
LVLSSVRTEHSFGIVFCQERTFLWWLSSVRTEHSFGDCLLSEQNIPLVIVFCQNRTFL